MKLVVSREEMQYLPPRWYGLAYYDWLRNVDVYWPVPVNLLVRVARRVDVWWARVRSYRSRFDRDLRQARVVGWETGYNKGDEDGHAAGRQAVIAQMRQAMVDTFGVERAARILGEANGRQQT